MHALLYVLCPKDGVNSSSEARDSVYQWLIDEHFVGEGGYFATPIADWFVIGGRWSGELTRIKLNQKKLKVLNDEFDKKYGWWINKDNPEELRLQQFLELQNKHFPSYKGLPLAWRDSYEDKGFEDDAQIVDKIIYNRIIKKNLLQKVDREKMWKGGTVISVDMFNKSLKNKPETFINKYWIVVIDFHF